MLFSSINLSACIIAVVTYPLQLILKTTELQLFTIVKKINKIEIKITAIDLTNILLSIYTTSSF